MEDLTFGEQVKIILGRKGMTIKELAETIELETGKKMSRQNLTQRLGRDNFQEQDMRMIARILGCPFRLSIMSKEMSSGTAPAHTWEERAAAQERTIQKAEAAETVQKAAETARAKTVAAEEGAVKAAAREQDRAESSGKKDVSEAALSPDERDITIGELYEIHQELSELEANIKADEPIEELKEESEKPKREWFKPGGFFLRKKQGETAEQRGAAEVKESPMPESAREEETEISEPAYAEESILESGAGQEEDYGAEMPESENAGTGADMNEDSTSVPENGRQTEDFEPVISHDDAEEDREIGEVNPYTGKEYQSNSVRMHPTRIGYVQVYDRKIHKWTDMTEWAFLGYQERKKALLGKAYEPPIYLD